MGRPEIWNGGDNTPTTTDTKRVLLIKLIKTEIDNGGGGGAGVQQVFPGHYGGAAPGFTPPADYAVSKDLDPPFLTLFWNPDTQAWE